MENMQNKITTWWKKTLLILSTYILWFLIVSIINFSYDNYIQEKWVTTFFVLFIWFAFYLLLPLISIYLTKKIIIKKTNVNQNHAYFLNIIVIFSYFYIFLR